MNKSKSEIYCDIEVAENPGYSSNENTPICLRPALYHLSKSKSSDEMRYSGSHKPLQVPDHLSLKALILNKEKSTYEIKDYNYN